MFVTDWFALSFWGVEEISLKLGTVMLLMPLLYSFVLGFERTWYQMVPPFIPRCICITLVQRWARGCETCHVGLNDDHGSEGAGHWGESVGEGGVG